jgi:hypothetical protein
MVKAKSNIINEKILPKLALRVDPERSYLHLLIQEAATREYLRGRYHCTIDLLFDWFGLVFLEIKTKIVSFHTVHSKPVKQVVNSTVILSSLVFPAATYVEAMFNKFE